MPQIRPITDLKNTEEISELCHARKEPIFITKNGYGDLVVMSIEAYEQLTETKADTAETQGAFPIQTGSPDVDSALDALWKKQLSGMQ